MDARSLASQDVRKAPVERNTRRNLLLPRRYAGRVDGGFDRLGGQSVLLTLHTRRST